MANKPYPFSVCKECAGGGSGGGGIDLSGYVEKIDGYGLAKINHFNVDDNARTYTTIEIEGADEHNGFAKIYYCLSQFDNDAGFVKQADIDTSIQRAILDSWEVEV